MDLPTDPEQFETESQRKLRQAERQMQASFEAVGQMDGGEALAAPKTEPMPKTAKRLVCVLVVLLGLWALFEPGLDLYKRHADEDAVARLNEAKALYVNAAANGRYPDGKALVTEWMLEDPAGDRQAELIDDQAALRGDVPAGGILYVAPDWERGARRGDLVLAYKPAIFIKAVVMKIRGGRVVGIERH